MRTSYRLDLGASAAAYAALLCLDDPAPPTGNLVHTPLWILTFLVVPVEHRRQGNARRLLDLVTADADREEVALLLSIQPDDDPDAAPFEVLDRLYREYGFEPCFPDGDPGRLRRARFR